MRARSNEMHQRLAALGRMPDHNEGFVKGEAALRFAHWIMGLLNPSTTVNHKLANQALSLDIDSKVLGEVVVSPSNNLGDLLNQGADPGVATPGVPRESSGNILLFTKGGLFWELSLVFRIRRQKSAFDAGELDRWCSNLDHLCVFIYGCGLTIFGFN